VFLGLIDQVPALGRGGMRHATGVDDNQFRRVRGIGLGQSEGLQKLANLLTLVLIHFTAES
jgi:hypothetical protein